MASCMKFHASVSGSSSGRRRRRSDGCSPWNTRNILGNPTVFSFGFSVVASNFSKYFICYATEDSSIRSDVHLWIYHVCLTFWRISEQMQGIIKCLTYSFLFANFQGFRMHSLNYYLGVIFCCALNELVWLRSGWLMWREAIFSGWSSNWSQLKEYLFKNFQRMIMTRIVE